MKNNNHITNKAWVLLGILGIFVTACSPSGPNPISQGIAATPTPYISVQNSAVVFSTMEELLKHTEIIVIGRPVSEKGIINTARDVSDLSQTDPDYFSISQVYEVEVLRYIKGNGANTLYVIQHHGSVLGSQELSESDIEAARETEDVIPLVQDARYVMFLAYSSFTYEGYPPEQLVGGRGHPWRFRINEQDCVQPEDSLGMLNYFPPQTLDGFIQWIENPDAYEVNSVYPAPEVLNPCTINPLSNPYP